MNDTNEKDIEIVADETGSSPSPAKTLLLLGVSFVAGYLLGRRRVEQTWDAGQPVEITDRAEESADVAGTTVEIDDENEDEAESERAEETDEDKAESEGVEETDEDEE